MNIKYTDPIYKLTQHCRQRYHERVLGVEWRGLSKVDGVIWRKFKASKELLGWQNDTPMVDYYRSKYGTTKVKIFHNEGFVFIAMRDKAISNLYFITTCFEPKVGNWIKSKIG